MSETESYAMDSEDDASSTSTHEFGSPMTTNHEIETEEGEKNPWMVEAIQQRETAFEEMKMNLIDS